MLAMYAHVTCRGLIQSTASAFLVIRLLPGHMVLRKDRMGLGV